MALAEVVARPHWNMTYHEGQINYIAALLPGASPSGAV